MSDTILHDIIEEVQQDICDNYCRFPEEYILTKHPISKYESKNNYIDDYQLFEQHCKFCPLRRLEAF